MIETDENRVMQVLLSISTNAVKFTENGRVTVIVEIVQRESYTYLQV